MGYLIDYNCACLVDIKDDKILLVRVRKNEKFYLPGGKIEKEEDVKSALIRELNEELDINIHENDLVYLYDIVGNAYPDTNKQVKLNCFKTTAVLNNISANEEITEIKYISLYDFTKMAPAVIELINQKIKET